ncbi:uncharacterized protein STEHIDRAFT_132732 [Stereum hirsutum FP-91666 SS1]|uniref:uncharacterized protein n=1 Tax=Stereum hirsutum (strain FP-91666) TaxID=721885 RepID=UPI000444A619|nr:uncharacterized protein STEHIDRAFT_132732 [Stereum hirsutum FP-91666 SS1]EIM84371.1 hypothetical protein STEHIDRAFT_132732 [Stereum hirsutum FP-91666 SS1]
MAYESKPGTGSSYDQSLLANAPEVTRAEKQEGYNVDLLEEGRPRGAASPAIAHTSDNLDPSSTSRAFEGPGPRGAGGYTRTLDSDPTTYPANGTTNLGTKRPWYRTRTGIIAIVIIVLVIIGAVVGGAVGGTRHKSSNNAVVPSPTASASSSASGASSAESAGATSTGSEFPGSVGVGTAAASTTTSDGQGVGESNGSSTAAATPTPSFEAGQGTS